VIVVGSRNSSNSNRLREVAERVGVSAHLVEDASGVDPQWLVGHARIGLTAGASAPELLVQQVVERLWQMGAREVHSLDGVIEEVVFPLPKGLGGPSSGESEAHYAIADDPA